MQTQLFVPVLPLPARGEPLHCHFGYDTTTQVPYMLAVPAHEWLLATPAIVRGVHGVRIGTAIVLAAAPVHKWQAHAALRATIAVAA